MNARFSSALLRTSISIPMPVGAKPPRASLADRLRALDRVTECDGSRWVDAHAIDALIQEYTA